MSPYREEEPILIEEMPLPMAFVVPIPLDNVGVPPRIPLVRQQALARDFVGHPQIIHGNGLFIPDNEIILIQQYDDVILVNLNNYIGGPADFQNENAG